ncbi:syntaxin [Pseudoscourfieldia marina]
MNNLLGAVGANLPASAALPQPRGASASAAANVASGINAGEVVLDMPVATAPPPSTTNAAPSQPSSGIGRFRANDNKAGAVVLSMAQTAAASGVDAAQTAAAGAIANDPMGSFFAEVSEVKSLIAAVEANFGKLVDANERAKSITAPERLKQSREDMAGLVTETQRLAKKCKDRLDALQSANESVRQQCGANSTQDRTRTSVTAGLQKKLKTTLESFQALRHRLQSEHREVVEMRVEAVTGQAPSEEQVEELIASGKAETVFQTAMLEQGRGRVLEAVAELQERHEAIRELERGLLDLHQCFLDMAVLVDRQGELLDNIEANVKKSLDHVVAGQKQLVQAKSLQQNTRKWMCWALIILLIIVCVIVVGVLKPWQSGSA